MRGLQNKSPSADTLRTMNRMRGMLSIQDAKAVANSLHGDVVYRKLALPHEFPNTPANFDDSLPFDILSLEVEIAMLHARQETNESKLVSAIKQMAVLSNQILSEQYSAALDTVETIRSHFGYSIRLLNKVAFIFAQSPPGSESSERSKVFLDACGMSTRNFLARGVVDALSANYNYLSIRNNIATRGKLEMGSRFSHDLGNWLFYPIQTDATLFASQLQSHRMASLIDATYVLLENTRNIDDGARFNINQFCSPSLVEAWDGLSSIPLPLHLLTKGGDSKDPGFQVYRHSISWLELRPLSLYRARCDALYRVSEEHDFPIDTLSHSLTSDYYSEVGSLSDLAVERGQMEILPKKYNPQRDETFERTLALLYIIKAPSADKLLTTPQLLILMNSTRDLDSLISVGELDSLLLENTPDEMFRTIVLTLQARRTGSARLASRLRLAFEKLVRAKHGGSIVDFFADLAGKAPDVARYLFDVCDERFLDLLYDIIPENASVLQVRADLLRWYGNAFADDAFLERARIMEIDERIQRVRGTIDDTRIYVDMVRFSHWIQDTHLDEINALSRERRADPRDISLISPTLVAEVPSLPEVRMAKVLQSCFQTFCESTHFGIAAYLARRIRHGTLEGALTARVDELMSDIDETAAWSPPGLHGFASAWSVSYRHKVLDLGTERLHIRTKSKPRGLINAEIWSGKREKIVQNTVEEIFRNFDHADGIPLAVGAIQRSCWQLIQPDLDKIRSSLAGARALWGTIGNIDQLKLTGDDRRAAKELFSRINIATDDAFKTVISWFHQPQEMAPSAPLSILFEAVIREVQESYPRFQPTVKLSGASEITLTGGVYHIVYDALFILIGNAAKHCPEHVAILRRFEILAGNENKNELVVTIATECSSASQLEVVRECLQAALSGDTSLANFVDQKSGFLKLAHMLEHSRELLRIVPDFSGGYFQLALHFELIA